MKETIIDKKLLVDIRINRFIKRHNVLTLATLYNDGPYCCNCFYVFDEENVRFVILSEDKTQHIKNILMNNRVGGTIYLETIVVGKIQGVQFTGIINRPDNKEINKLRLKYLKRYPFAVFKIEDIWVIDVDFIKYTDNRLGFGKKLIWNKRNA